MTAHRKIIGAFTAVLGLLAVNVIFVAGPAAAQEGTPFIKPADPASCNGGSTSCTIEFNAVPANHRWDIASVACRNNLLTPDTSRENVDLQVRGGGGNLVATYPLLPLNITNSNIWVVSQEVFVPVTQNRHAEIVVQSFGGAIVGGIVQCTITGHDVTLP